MERTEIEKAFTFLKKDEHFEFVNEYDGHVTFHFITRVITPMAHLESQHLIKIPEQHGKEVKWYFIKNGKNITFDEGHSLKETDEWFQKIVKRTELAYECVQKNIRTKKVSMERFDYLKEHEFFSEVEESADYFHVRFVDGERYTHTIHVPKWVGYKLDWYFYIPYKGSLTLRKGDCLSETLPWFQKLVEKTKGILDELKISA